MTDEKKPKARTSSGLPGYVVIGLLGAGLAYGVTIKGDHDYAKALDNYRVSSQREAQDRAKSISDSFKLMYQGIRTISMLPSVRTIDRHGTNLDANANASIHEIYRNMISNVQVSEIYIVPANLEPEEIDATTGSLQVPILMYDGSDEEKSDKPEALITTVEQALKADEVEIFEYRLLKEQMTWFKANIPNTKLLKDSMNVPLIGGPAVLTCDNADYDKTKNDEDRKGAVFSVPFYGLDGQLRGSITAIIRNNVLRGMLPAQNTVLMNETYDYRLSSEGGGQQQASAESVQQYKPDPSLLFSTVVPVETADPNSKWLLWVGYPDERFLNSGDAKAVSNFRSFGYAASVILTLVGWLVWAMIRRSHAQMARNNMELEERIRERTAEIEQLAALQESQKAEAERQKRQVMHQMADNFESSVKDVVSRVASSAVQMREGAENVSNIAADTKRLSSKVVESSNEVSQTSSQVAAAAEELTASISEISSQTQKSNQVAQEASHKAESAKTAIHMLAEKASHVSDIIQVITGIAEQINLLALNATIESARAGEAGKGFAVVASEVKNLATQVSKAADEITRQIGEMRAATNTSVDSVMDIIGIIGQVSNSTTAVAAAVEEQSAVTNEIARNITTTSSGIQQISSNISSVENGADNTGQTAGQTLATAQTLNEQAALLKQKVDEFLKTIRSA